MRTNIFLAGIAIFVLPLSSPAYAGDKDQKGNGGDKVKSAQGNGGERKANNGNKGAGKTMDRIRGNGDQYVRSNGKGEKANGAKLASPVGNDFNGDRKFERKAEKAGVVNIARGDMKRGDNSRMRIFENGRYAWREPSFQGCPPGLAKKTMAACPQVKRVSWQALTTSKLSGIAIQVGSMQTEVMIGVMIKAMRTGSINRQA